MTKGPGETTHFSPDSEQHIEQNDNLSEILRSSTAISSVNVQVLKHIDGLRQVVQRHVSRPATLNPVVSAKLADLFGK